MGSPTTNQVKADQLGMPIGTAANRLRKLILFDLIREAGRNICFQCGEAIESDVDLSVEHKTPWLHSANPVETFFDLSNVGFSHRSCNSMVRRVPINLKPCGTDAAYNRGCRCEACRSARAEYRKNWQKGR